MVTTQRIPAEAPRPSDTVRGGRSLAERWFTTRLGVTGAQLAASSLARME